MQKGSRKPRPFAQPTPKPSQRKLSMSMSRSLVKCQGAGGGNRTHTGLRPERCEGSASTSSATPAPLRQSAATGYCDAT